ncbi:DUF2946 family protein [Verminephrobacter aporrectodeae subsp. tuberculatae]|uniref:DUF2946 family protein n=1 Tax=Verminephrobacter aporrectodeae TaxID=1110389 RepID=UPI00223838F6|nr:DUF2946 family protein [Verminephrobacter aporrectodeae]MCW5223003.1 DUF2946 family protein [Verminephrobacter aporrectodeae subsp. tuberculatae]MCW5256781.1 DUF2946 family protein [Verminephrobacter aporrectodeae subsp. tuberculatae]MCW5288467.1 DUF2946 family protein [Verminephrobacter aporrectodeae subsp. tuberculatae]MCW8205894.1 DUF2946 family protein [Verminephrobacter aporrectodeae subsp. tuberculatae]
MDDIVKQALGKWPNVPDCCGWLGLDARGRWYMRDDATQAAGAFPHSKGALLQHEGLIGFIARNYEPDAQGQWFFQNGPQRVYVELEITPWIWRLQADGFSVVSHTGRRAVVHDCLVDAQGRVYLDSDIGVGLVHTLDVALAADAVDAGHWTPRDVRAEDLPARHGYVLSPRAAANAGAKAPARPRA